VPEADAFYVHCDHTANPAQSAAPSEFRILIGFAAGRQHDFKYYRVTHSVVGSKVAAERQAVLGVPMNRRTGGADA
ncbi:MAG: hypothetical protein M3O06_02995, partial [Pseudomonadota bacterium]|nr:hypothetical protein [Pseudomonadota bacterium]